MTQKLVLTCLVLLCSFISCRKIEKATSPTDLMGKLQRALIRKDAKTIEKYVLIDSSRTPEMAKALSELIVAIKNPAPMPKGSGGLNLPPPSVNIIMNLTMANNFSDLLNGVYDEEREELMFEKTVGDSITGTLTVTDAVTLKKTKEGYKYWPIGIANNAIIYTNELYKRLPEAVSADSVTQRKNIDRLLELYVPKEERVLMEKEREQVRN